MLAHNVDLDLEHLTKLLKKLKEKALIEELFQSKLKSVNSEYRKTVNQYFTEKIEYVRKLHVPRSKQIPGWKGELMER